MGGGRDMHQYQPQSHHQPQRNLIDSPEAYEVLDVVLAQVTVVSLQLIGTHSSKYYFKNCCCCFWKVEIRVKK